MTASDPASATPYPGDPDIATQSLARLPVILERLDSGGFRLSSPDLPGWSATGHGPHQLARCMDEAWVELQIAAYSRRHGQEYDLAHLAATPKTARPEAARRWPSPYDPRDWVPLPGGDWLSPSGRRYRADTTTVAKVKARRAQLGLPVIPADEEATP